MRQSKLKNRIIYFFISFSILLSSCSGSSNKSQETSEKSRQTESTGEIVNKYVDTLTTARDKAKKAADAEKKRVEGVDKAAQEEEKQ